MKAEILDLMEKRRKLKGKDMDKYNILNRDKKKRCRATTEELLSNKLQEIEEKRTPTNIHDKINDIAGKRKGGKRLFHA